MSVYYHSYNAFGTSTTVTPIDEGTQAQVNYEQDLLNRILALGITNTPESKDMGSLLFAKIKGMHDRSEQDRVLQVLAQLREQYDFYPETREQVDHLVWSLRVSNWEDLDNAVLVQELNKLKENQDAGTIPEMIAYAITGQDVRPTLKEIWLNPQAKDRKAALELATYIDLARRAHHALAVGRGVNGGDDPQMINQLSEAIGKSRDLGIKLGLEKDVNYTLSMFDQSDAELSDAIATAKVTAVPPNLKKAATEAEIILASPDPELDNAVQNESHAQIRKQWLIGGACLLGLLYIFRRPQGSYRR